MALKKFAIKIDIFMKLNKIKRFFDRINSLDIFLQVFLAGILAAFAFAPFDLFFPLVISISWFYYLFNKSLDFSKKKIFLLGLFYGVGYFLAGVYWVSISLLVDISQFWWLLPFSITLFPLVLGLFFAFLSLVSHFIFKKFKLEEYQKVLLFSGFWLIFELIRGYIFTGFPWNLAGYSMMFNDYAMQSASIFGVYGLSFFAVLFCLIPILYLVDKKQERVVANILFVLFVVNLASGIVRLETAKPEYMGKKVRLVQGNVEQNLKWDSQEKYKNFVKHFDISESKGFENIDGFIWSETSISYPIGFYNEIDGKIKNFVDKNDQFLISGALKLNLDIYSGKVSKAFNSVFIFSKDGLKSYNKHHLVPFGEYIPLQKYLPFVKKITNGSDGFASGEGPKTLEVAGIKISPLICYEVIFPYNVVDSGDRPELFVNVTNDAWFGVSSGPYQHLNMSRMRAVEYGISMARAANTGVSAYIDPYGRIIEKIALNETGFIDVELIRPTNPTILSHFKFFMLLFILSVMAMLERLYTIIIKNPKNENHKKY